MMFPGVPNEMKKMFEYYAKPLLRTQDNGTIFSKNINLYGVSECYIESLLVDLMETQNPTVAPYAKTGEVAIRVSCLGKDQADAQQQMQPIIEEIISRCKAFPYAIDKENIQTAVVEKLKENHLTLATAESLTGGLISKMITDVDGSSSVFHMGVCSYANDIKHQVLGVSNETLQTHGAVSACCAKEMAEGIRRLATSDLAIATTGLAGRSDGAVEKETGLVFIALATSKGTDVFEYHLNSGRGNERERIRTLSAIHAFILVMNYLNA